MEWRRDAPSRDVPDEEGATDAVSTDSGDLDGPMCVVPTMHSGKHLSW